MYLSIFAPFCIHSLRTYLSSGAGVCTSISHIFYLSMYISANHCFLPRLSCVHQSNHFYLTIYLTVTVRLFVNLPDRRLQFVTCYYLYLPTQSLCPTAYLFCHFPLHYLPHLFITTYVSFCVFLSHVYYYVSIRPLITLSRLPDISQYLALAIFSGSVGTFWLSSLPTPQHMNQELQN